MNSLVARAFCESDGSFREMRFLHGVGVADVEEVIEHALRGKEKNSGIAITDGIIVFSCGGKHVAFTADHDVLLKMSKKIGSGDVYFTPVKEGVLEGIAIVTP